MAWAPSYATTAELAAHVRIGDSVDDVQLGLCLAGASRAIDQACNRQFGLSAAPVARYYTARWDKRLWQWAIDVDDLMTSTGLVVEFDSAGDQTYSSAITDFSLQPVNAAADGRPWAHIYVRASSAVQPFSLLTPGPPLPLAGVSGPGPVCPPDAVRVTAQWGWTTVPDAVKQACLIQAARLLADRDAPFGVAGSPETGSEMRLLSRLHPDVAVTLRPYRRTWGAV